MRFPTEIRRSVLVGLSLATLAAIIVAGCSRDEANPIAPANNASPSALSFSSRTIPADAPEVRAAIAAQNRATHDLLRIDGVIGTGTSADERGRPFIIVYADRAEVAGVPVEIEGIATKVWNIGKVVPYAKPGSGGPLQMGTSTGNDNECASGTLGCVVVKGGVDYFLSNNHVFARMNDASNGERIDAPGRYDGKPICAQTPICATLSDFEPIGFGSRGNNPDNVIDAAIARPDPSRPYTQVMESGYDPSSTVVAASVGLAVKKHGRTSNLTHSTVQAINVTITVGYPNGNAKFVQQIQMSGQFIRSGDSGSLMVTETGENPVGLCFAGSSQASFANPIGPVLQRFGATVK
jgi:hypothetical protein